MLSTKLMYEIIESLGDNNCIDNVDRMTDNFIANHPDVNRKEILLTMNMVIAIYKYYNNNGEILKELINFISTIKDK